MNGTRCTACLLCSESCAHRTGVLARARQAPRPVSPTGHGGDSAGALGLGAAKKPVGRTAQRIRSWHAPIGPWRIGEAAASLTGKVRTVTVGRQRPQRSGVDTSAPFQHFAVAARRRAGLAVRPANSADLGALGSGLARPRASAPMRTAARSAGRRLAERPGQRRSGLGDLLSDFFWLPVGRGSCATAHLSRSFSRSSNPRAPDASRPNVSGASGTGFMARHERGLGTDSMLELAPGGEGARDAAL